MSLISKRVLYFITFRSSFLFNILTKSLFVGFFNISYIYIKRLASEDHQMSEDQKTILDNHSQLSFGPHAPLLSHARTPSFGRENALRPYLEPSQNEMLVPIFGAKPERNACAHIWSQARTKRLCPYLGLSQSAHHPHGSHNSSTTHQHTYR